MAEDKDQEQAETVAIAEDDQAAEAETSAAQNASDGVVGNPVTGDDGGLGDDLMSLFDEVDEGDEGLSTLVAMLDDIDIYDLLDQVREIQDIIDERQGR